MKLFLNSKLRLISILLIVTVSATYANDLVRLNFELQPKVQANAGNDVLITLGQTATIGGLPAASDGIVPYDYLWVPGSCLSDSLIANPVATPGYCMTYMFWVTDDIGCTSFDFINVNVMKNGKLLKKGDAGLTSFRDEVGEVFNIYPNPSGKFIFIQTGKSDNSDMNIEILTISGSKCKEIQIASGIQSNPIDISGLNKGIYVVKVKIGDKFINKKLVVE
jgi:hypothetical protein